MPGAPRPQRARLNYSLIIKGAQSKVIASPFFWLTRLMPPAVPPVSTSGHQAHPLGFNLAAITLMLIMAGLGLAYAITDFGKSSQRAPQLDAGGPTLSRSLLGKTLKIPATWMASSENGNAPGFASEIDLRLLLPLDKNGALLPVQVTLVPRSQVQPSATLLDGVYLHQFTRAELSGPKGLVGKPLRGTNGYEDETVWYDPLTAHPFVAKCIAPPDGRGAARCLRTVALGDGIAAIYQFSANGLPAWRRFDDEMEKWLKKIGAI